MGRRAQPLAKPQVSPDSAAASGSQRTSLAQRNPTSGARNRAGTDAESQVRFSESGVLKLPPRIAYHGSVAVGGGVSRFLNDATAAGVGVFGAKLAWQSLRERGLPSVLGRSALTTALVFSFFQVLPHFPVGVSEVHFILGSTLFLLFGAAPAAIGLALGLLIQGLFFTPFDLPQ